MSLADSFRKKKSRTTAGADPAQAFGSEELTMEEIQRQTFVPPKEKGPGLAQRAGTALNNLRQKIVGEDPVEEAFPDYHEPAPAPRTEAPVYSAQTYQSEAAPELGWENPFTDTPSKKKTPVSTPRRARPVSRSYPEYGSYPETLAYPETPYGYQGQDPYYGQNYAPDPYGYAPQGAPEGYPMSGYSPQDAGYSQDVRGQVYYPPVGYAAYQPPYDAYPQGGYAPQPGYGPAYDSAVPPAADPYGYDPAAQGYGEVRNAAPGRTPVRRSAPRGKMEIGDFKYMFWSGSIVIGVLLTVTAFIYGCSI